MSLDISELIPIILFGCSLLASVAVGIPIGLKALIKLIRNAEKAFKDGEITEEEFEVIIEDLLHLGKLAIRGLNWLLEKLNRK